MVCSVGDNLDRIGTDVLHRWACVVRGSHAPGTFASPTVNRPCESDTNGWLNGPRQRIHRRPRLVPFAMTSCHQCVGLLILLLIGSGCSRAPESRSPAADTTARVLSSPGRNRDGALRILISHDMEGLSGQADWRTFLTRFPEHFKTGQRLLADDVNAVIDGLFAGGATAVDVFDQHGGGTIAGNPDIPRELLDPRAKHVFMSEAITADLAARGNYDALVGVGEHSKTGSRGFAAHSMDLGAEIVVNGMSITEVELKAYQWGEFGVPLIFVSGDDRTAQDLVNFPWIEFVVTKRAVGADSAELRPVAEVHAEMREKAQLAVQNVSKAKVARLTRPVTVTIHAVPPASLTGLRGLPGMRFGDQSVTYTEPSLQDDAFTHIDMVVARAVVEGKALILHDSLSATPQGRALLSATVDTYWRRWFDYESGRWTPPSANRH